MIRPLILTLLGSQLCHADLAITEVMAKSLHDQNLAGGSEIDGDWWELTNTGNEAVDLTGYLWDDTPTPLTPSVSTFPAFTIQPGESVVILQEDVSSIGAWRSAWGLDASTRVLSREQFSVGVPGGESFSSFSADGDEVNLYDPGGNLLAHVEFGASTTGVSKGFHRDGRSIYGRDSSLGKQGAYASDPVFSDTASPGDGKIHFTTPPVIFAAGDFQYEVVAASPSGTPQLSAEGLPEFLSFTADEVGGGSLVATRPLTLADTGAYLIGIDATDGSDSTTQEFLLTVLNPAPTVVLNEFNAVSGTNFLNGGDVTADEDGGDPSMDTHFGRVAGNGGDWVEWVVVGDGSAGRLDLRGWSVEIGKDEGVGFSPVNTIVFSDHIDWEGVPTGTILTLTEDNSAQGGLDSGFAIRDNRATTGDTWSNVWIGDSARLTYTSEAANGYSVIGGVVSGVQIDNDGTQFRIRNAAGEVVFGPVGEGVAPTSGTSSTEVFELENHPGPGISPLVETGGGIQGYDDGASESTFGSPNNWLVGETPATQDFSPFIASGFLLWTEARGLAGDDGLQNADPDIDGRDNLSEYAFGGDPTIADGGYPAGPVTVGGTLGWSYVRRSSDAGLVFSHESSESLTAWEPLVPAESSVEPFPGDADFETVTLGFELPSPAPAGWFVRARAE